jgi:hypothetical protein
MRCPHCTIDFHEHWSDARMSRGIDLRVTGRRGDYEVYWHYRTTVCSKCKDVIIEIAPVSPAGERLIEDWRMVYPIGTSRWAMVPEVPADIANDYIEACNVLPISPKASAALSR